MADHLQAGHVFEGYKIRRVLRRDRVGVEYEASVQGGYRLAIIKEYLPEGIAERREGAQVAAQSAADRTLFNAGLAHFLAQYETLGRIDHPAIVKVHECVPINGTGCAVMDHPQGETLAQLLESRDRLSRQELAGVLGPVVDGLEKVHLANLLHREINLDNIVVQPDGTPVLIGFGTAPVAGGGPRQAFSHRSPSFVGSLAPGYAALEQYSHRGQEGPWTDIYALGAVMYRCVTGAVAADAPGRAVQDDMVPAVRAAEGAYDRQTLAGIDAALALRVVERPRSLAAWRAALTGSATRQSAARGRMAARQLQPSSAHFPPPAAAEPARAAARPATRGHAMEASQPRGPSWALPALAATVLIALLTWVDTGILRSTEDDPPLALAAAEDAAAGSEEPAAVPPGDARTSLPPGDIEPQASAAETNGVLPGTDELASRLVGEVDVWVSSATELADPAVGSPVGVGEAPVIEPPAEPEMPTSTEAGLDDESLIATARPETDGESDAADPMPREEAAVPVAARGSLTLNLIPVDAEVAFLDDAALYRPGMRLPEGEYRMRVSGTGHLPQIHTVTVAGATRMSIALAPETQPFAVLSVPPGASVRFADGGASYSPGMVLAPGDYRVAVALPGYRTWEGLIAHRNAPTRREITLDWVVTEFSDPLASGGVGPAMVVVPPGASQMGCVSGIDCFNNELPVLSVAFNRRFAVSKHEITYDDYDRFTATTRRRPAESLDGWGRGARPVVNVSWNDAAAYTRWLSAETGRAYRLPSEAEWEYTARGGSVTAYSWGNGIGDGRANCTGCGGVPADRGTRPVGSFPANPWGLYDLHGNVWEWVADCPDGAAAAHPARAVQQMAARCPNRVRRGGSWVHSPRRMRSASRDITIPELISLDTGFRVLLQAE